MLRASNFCLLPPDFGLLPSAVVALFAVIALGTFGSVPGAARPQPAQPTRSVWDGVYTDEQAARGEVLYVETCLTCHGEGMQGGDEVPSLSGGDFTASWNGVTLGDMLERQRISMPFDDPGTLSRQRNADVIAYILQFNGFPAGEFELPRQDPLLQQILFEALKR